MADFIFFVGRTLINEKNFSSYVDSRLLYLLNGFGARIDNRNYDAIKKDVIKNRKVGNGGIVELIVEICRVLMPTGYEKIILKHIIPSIEFAEKHFLYPHDDAIKTLEILSQNFKIGIISNQDKKIMRVLENYELDKYFDVCIFSYDTKYREHDQGIFKLGLDTIKKKSEQCIMIGDRLDKDILPANILGMTTIRFTNSKFRLQEPLSQYEIPKFTMNNLIELIKITSKI